MTPVLNLRLTEGILDILESCIMGCQNSDLTVSESHERVSIGYSRYFIFTGQGEFDCYLVCLTDVKLQ